MKNIVICLFVLVLTTSCLKKVESSGYSFDDIDLNSVRLGITTKDNVLKELGTPSIISRIDSTSPEIWIYYSDTQYGYMFFHPVVKNQEIVALSFDENNIVSMKKTYDIQARNNVNISDDSTPAKERNDSIVSDILNNIGSVKSM